MYGSCTGENAAHPQPHLAHLLVNSDADGRWTLVRLGPVRGRCYCIGTYMYIMYLSCAVGTTLYDTYSTAANWPSATQRIYFAEKTYSCLSAEISQCMSICCTDPPLE